VPGDVGRAARTYYPATRGGKCPRDGQGQATNPLGVGQGFQAFEVAIYNPLFPARPDRGEGFKPPTSIAVAGVLGDARVEAGMGVAN